MSTKIDISKIIADHLGTLKDQGDNNASSYDLWTFYGVPLLVAVLHLIFSSKISPADVLDIDGILVSAFSIFAALLLNVQVLIIGLKERLIKSAPLGGDTEPRSPEDTIIERRIQSYATAPLQELFANVSYAILIAMLVVTFTLISIFVNIPGSEIVVAIQFFGIVHFALTSIMILKRMHVVFLNYK